MTSSTPERRERWGIDERKAMDFLESAGYRLDADWCWVSPKVTGANDKWTHCTDKEADAIIFLIEEWDMGGLKNDQGTDCIPWVAKAEQAEG